MATIRSLDIDLGLKTGELVLGSSKATQSLQRFKTAGIDPAISGTSRLQEVMKGAGHGLSGLGSAIGSAIGFAQGAMVKLFGVVQAAAISIDETGDMADRLGTTTAALSELMYATKLTGSEAGELSGALMKMNANMGDAAARGGPAADALKRIGLDARELATMDPAEAFLRIAGGFRSIETPAEKASLAMDIFGRTGVNLLGTLSAGPEELRRLSAEFRSFGGSVTESQRAAVGAMFDSLDRLGAMVAGVGTQLAAQLSPFITSAVDEFTAMGASGESMGDRVTKALRSITIGVAATAEGLQTLLGNIEKSMLGIKALGIAFTLAQTGSGQKGYDEMIAAQVKVGARLNELGKDQESWAKAIEDGFDRIALKAKGTAPALASVAAAGKSIAVDMTASLKKVADLETSIRAEMEALGKAGHEAALFKLQLDGIPEAALKGARALDAQFKAMERGKKLVDEISSFADALTESMLTPLEKYRKEIGKIGEALALGMIDQKTADLAAKKAGGNLDEMNKPHLSGAYELGSREAGSIIANALSRPSSGMESVAKQQLIQQEAAAGLLQKIANRMDQRPATDQELGL